jgi:3'-phosphoadenosine 5'-phosphosulfate sulfotransferase (PAPS reductase)/FAD synthetase
MGGSTEVIDEPEVATDPSFVLHPLSLAVCLVSGGMDSCVTAAIAREENDEVAFLHVSYGQRLVIN